VDIAENLWNRVSFGGKPHAYTFTPAGPERRTVVVAGTREAISIEAGVQDLILMKTSGAGFEGYRRDPFTTLPTSGDQMLTTAVTARWLYSENEIPFGPYWHGIREAMLETFIEHESLSPQQTLYVIAEAVLERYQDIVEINLEIPKRNCVLVDLAPFALENENDVFVPVDEPHEIIRARVRRD
jgi:urate oxidase